MLAAAAFVAALPRPCRAANHPTASTKLEKKFGALRERVDREREERNQPKLQRTAFGDDVVVYGNPSQGTSDRINRGLNDYRTMKWNNSPLPEKKRPPLQLEPLSTDRPPQNNTGKK
ncbi:MAG: hypothetical protein HY078_17035 [Elusimicrobia bacterium]|nr:hypothetical protein [Elusimicrobiota bacterium]